MLPILKTGKIFVLQPFTAVLVNILNSIKYEIKIDLILWTWFLPKYNIFLLISWICPSFPTFLATFWWFFWKYLAIYVTPTQQLKKSKLAACWKTRRTENQIGNYVSGDFCQYWNLNSQITLDFDILIMVSKAEFKKKLNGQTRFT